MEGDSPIPVGMDQVPILVGIIGHRDIPEDQHKELQTKVQAVFKALKRKYPRTPLMAVTALAEGADTIGAKAALAEGASLIAPLPMPPAEYKQTFSSPEKAAELDGLLAKALSHVCPSYSEHEDTQDDQFARAGAAVVQYSHLVIALWNGEDSGQNAGTSYLISHAITGIPKKIVFDLEGSKVSPLDPIATAMVRQIEVTRKSSPKVCRKGSFPMAPEGKFDVVNFGKRGKPDLKLTPTQKRMFEQFEDFNKVINHHRPKDGNWVSAAKEESKGDAPLVLVEDKAAGALPGGLQVLRERYAMADSLALHFQKRRHWRITRYVIVLAALVAFMHQLIGSKLPVAQMIKLPRALVEKLPLNERIDYQDTWPFFIYVLLLAVGYSTVHFARQRRWQARYLDYRTIAEGARIQFFWLIAGIRTPVVNFFLRKQRDELEWIRSALRLWYLRAVIHDGVIEDAPPEQAALIQKHWILDQLNYSSGRAERCNAIDRTLMILALVFLGVLFAGMIAQPFLEEQQLKRAIILATAGAGSCVLLASSLRYFLGYREAHKSTSRMTVLFSDANRFYNPYDGIQDEERAILEELGREALTETGDWLLMNRTRKVNLPKAP